mmetsp:Transcript_58797/g.86053  ORF Transcript_58797/g.86053 Transcript_58797/m.86053 type:complete len:90 (+) Transcript_58797:104-373(+)
MSVPALIVDGVQFWYNTTRHTTKGGKRKFHMKNRSIFDLGGSRLLIVLIKCWLISTKENTYGCIFSAACGVEEWTEVDPSVTNQQPPSL